MTEPKFTPGPWRHDLTGFCTPSAGHPEHGIDDSLILSADHRDIARIYRVYNGPRDVEMERANAALIAAAPDLYAELEAQRADMLESAHLPAHVRDRRVARIDAVLAKARGES